MSDLFRRIYNAIDMRLDRKTIQEERRLTYAGVGTRHPVTACQALKHILPAVRVLDRQARLKSIVSQSGISIGGLSPHWEFFFDLPQRRARISAHWSLPWEADLDHYGPAGISLFVKPFPPANSYLRQLVKEGKLLHQQLTGLWQQECQKTDYLPDKFRDSDSAAAEFSQQGLDLTQVEFTLCTGQSPGGRPAWIAQTRRKQYYTGFADGE